MVAAVRDGGDTFWPQRGYLSMMDAGDHGRDISKAVEHDLDDVLSEPAVKLVLRRPDVEAVELLGIADELAVPGISVSISGAPFLEVAAAGVSKATGLALLCEMLGGAAQRCRVRRPYQRHRDDFGLVWGSRWATRSPNSTGSPTRWHPPTTMTGLQS